MDSGRTDPDRELAEAKVDAAVEARRDGRLQREVQAAESTLRGLLFGLAVAARPLVIVSADGQRTAGVVIEVGTDMVVLETAVRQLVALRLSTVLTVETPLLAGSSGTIDAPQGALRTFTDLAADLVGTRWVVALRMTSGLHVDGEVLAVGQDIMIVRAGAQVIYVALDSLNEVAWSTGSG